jgi:hypothetical protein
VAAAYLDRQALLDGNTAALVVALGLGVCFSLADFVLLAVGTALEKHIGVWSSALGLARSLTALYAAHISLGVVAALLVPGGHLWGLAVVVVLVLLIQFSFNLLLKTKGAYGETIQALVRASELQAGPSEDGHAQRVADMCVHAGRLLGLSSKSLERLNYAALLHEIGRIGLDATAESGSLDSAHPQRGADIIGGIPFLASAQTMIRNQSASPPEGGLALDDEDALCAQLIGVCCALDRLIGSTLGRRWTADVLEAGLSECAPAIDIRVRAAVLSSWARGLRAQHRAFL